MMDNSEKSGNKKPVGRASDDVRTGDETDIRRGANDESIIEKMQDNAEQTKSPQQQQESGSPESERRDPGFGLGDTSAIENGDPDNDHNRP